MKDSNSNNKNFCQCGCGEEIAFISTGNKPQKFKWGHNTRGDKSNFWKGSNYVSPYISIKAPKDHPFKTTEGLILEHRYVWEQHNNAILLPCGNVHHINGNKKDNRIENLQAMTHAQHLSLHKSVDKSNRRCKICNGKTYFTRNREMWHGNESDGFLCHKCWKREKRRNRL